MKNKLYLSWDLKDKWNCSNRRRNREEREKKILKGRINGTVMKLTCESPKAWVLHMI